MKYLSLFSGIGGFELGIQQAYEYLSKTSREKQGRNKKNSSDIKQQFVARKQPTCIGYSEIDKYACQIYKKQFPNHHNYGDITKIIASELPDFDLICGGFPCQSFSIAGKRLGFNDTRGTLFFDICRIIKEKRPKYLLLENVKGLLSHDDGRTFKTIISTLNELRYDLQWQVLNSKNFGVPQNRERVFIVGHIRGESRPQVFPSWHFEQGVYNEKGITRSIKAGEGSGNKPKLLKDMKIRRLTPVECERLQGFPDGWTEGISDTQRYKTLGNAVTVNVIREIIKRLIN